VLDRDAVNRVEAEHPGGELGTARPPGFGRSTFSAAVGAGQGLDDPAVDEAEAEVVEPGGEERVSDLGGGQAERCHACGGGR
jgi:hypothetical protein